MYYINAMLKWWTHHTTTKVQDPELALTKRFIPLNLLRKLKLVSIGYFFTNAIPPDSFYITRAKT